MFDELLDDLEKLQKANGESDARIRKMASGPPDDYEEDDEDEDEEGHGEPDGDEYDQDGDGDGGEMMGKSFTLETEDGEKVQAFDASGLLKSFGASMKATDEKLTKGFETVAQLLKGNQKLIKSQSDRINRLEARVAEMAGGGRGRRSTVRIHERGLADGGFRKSQGAEMDIGELLAKADTAFEQGRITGTELRTLDASLRTGASPDPAVVAKVLKQ